MYHNNKTMVSLQPLILQKHKGKEHSGIHEKLYITNLDYPAGAGAEVLSYMGGTFKGLNKLKPLPLFKTQPCTSRLELRDQWISSLKRKSAHSCCTIIIITIIIISSSDILTAKNIIAFCPEHPRKCDQNLQFYTPK